MVTPARVCWSAYTRLCNTSHACNVSSCCTAGLRHHLHLSNIAVTPCDRNGRMDVGDVDHCEASPEAAQSAARASERLRFGTMIALASVLCAVPHPPKRDIVGGDCEPPLRVPEAAGSDFARCLEDSSTLKL
jgi:hypothetical protein